MKRNIIIKVAAVVAMLFVATVASAREWHINNKDGVPAHFADINAAMASEEVIEGDTLYIGNGCNITSEQTISKIVTVIGTGWSFPDSPISVGQVNSNLYITVNGVIVEGLRITGSVVIRANDVIVERCLVNADVINNNSVRADRVKLLSCIIDGSVTLQNGYNNNWEIRNCIIRDNDAGSSVYYLYNGVIENSIIKRNRVGYGTWSSSVYMFRNCSFCTIKNCILHFTKDDTKLDNVEIGYFINSCSNCTFRNNVISYKSSYENTLPGNVFTDVPNLSAVFNCTGSVESGEYYSLKEGSPAIGAGEGGIDCGVMVGAYKFIPYGRPQYIPVIKEAVVPAIPTDGKVKVSFKIENQND